MPGIERISMQEKHGARPRNPLYLFACHLEWRINRNLKAYQELVAALDDCDEKIRDLAQKLLQRCSLRPQDKNVHPKAIRP